MVHAAAERLAGEAAVVQVNTDENPLLARRFGIQGIPALHLIRGGRSVANLSGNRSLESLVAWFRSQHP